MKKQSSTKEPKILAIAFAVIGVICCCMGGFGIWGVNQMGNRMEDLSNNDPTAIAQVQDKIASFDVPPGYDVNGFSMLIYDTLYLASQPPDGRPSITLMQYNNGFASVNRQQMEQSLRQSAEQQNSQRGLSMQVVENFETIIREETVTVTVSEGSFEGYVIRQWMTLFDGNNGLVIMLAQGPVETWDDQLLEEFLASIE